jgi:hypothetical protein
MDGKRLIELGMIEGGGLKWAMSPEFKALMPNFSHGTAGVCYFLATLYQETNLKSSLPDFGTMSAVAEACVKIRERIIKLGPVFTFNPTGLAQALHTTLGLDVKPRAEEVFQDFYIERPNSNINPVYYLWADTVQGREISAASTVRGIFCGCHFSTNLAGFRPMLPYVRKEPGLCVEQSQPPGPSGERAFQRQAERQRRFELPRPR